MIPDIRGVKCIMCGKESVQHCGYLSYNSGTFSNDFFGNPNIFDGAQYCPHCGYANEEINSIAYLGLLKRVYSIPYARREEIAEKNKELYPKIKDLMESERYKTCDNQESLFIDKWDWVMENYRAFLVYECLGDYNQCAFTLLQLIFRIDERYLSFYAKDSIGREEYAKLMQNNRNKSDVLWMDSHIKAPRFCISYDDKNKDPQKYVMLTKKILLWMLERFFKYAKIFIDSYNKDDETTQRIDGYLMMIMNYVYYQRRYGDINEAEKYLELLNEIPKKNKMKFYLTMKISIFYQIEKENIDCIKNNKEPYMVNNAFGEYDNAERDYIDRLDYVSRMKLYNDK